MNCKGILLKDCDVLKIACPLPCRTMGPAGFQFPEKRNSIPYWMFHPCLRCFPKIQDGFEVRRQLDYPLALRKMLQPGRALNRFPHACGQRNPSLNNLDQQLSDVTPRRLCSSRLSQEATLRIKHCTRCYRYKSGLQQLHARSASNRHDLKKANPRCNQRVINNSR